MTSPDEEIAGQVFGGCGKFLVMVAIILAAFVGLIALIVNWVK